MWNNYSSNILLNPNNSSRVSSQLESSRNWYHHYSVRNFVKREFRAFVHYSNSRVGNSLHVGFVMYICKLKFLIDFLKKEQFISEEEYSRTTTWVCTYYGKCCMLGGQNPLSLPTNLCACAFLGERERSFKNFSL